MCILNNPVYKSSVENLSSSHSFLSSWQQCEDIILSVFDEILNKDHSISSEEKIEIERVKYLLQNEPMKNFVEAIPILNRLIAEKDAANPYLYFYYFLRGLNPLRDSLKEIIEDCNESIRLNPDFALAYYLRGIRKWEEREIRDSMAALEDFKMSAQKGCMEAQRMVDWIERGAKD